MASGAPPRSNDRRVDTTDITGSLSRRAGWSEQHLRDPDCKTVATDHHHGQNREQENNQEYEHPGFQSPARGRGNSFCIVHTQPPMPVPTHVSKYLLKFKAVFGWLCDSMTQINGFRNWWELAVCSQCHRKRAEEVHKFGRAESVRLEIIAVSVRFLTRFGLMVLPPSSYSGCSL